MDNSINGCPLLHPQKGDPPTESLQRTDLTFKANTHYFLVQFLHSYKNHNSELTILGLVGATHESLGRLLTLTRS